MTTPDTRTAPAKRERSNEEYRGMVSRILRAYAERVAWSDDFDLAELVSLQAEVDKAIEHAVIGQREHFGMTWAQIGAGLGTSRQGAFKRFAHLTKGNDE